MSLNTAQNELLDAVYALVKEEERSSSKVLSLALAPEISGVESSSAGEATKVVLAAILAEAGTQIRQEIGLLEQSYQGEAGSVSRAVIGYAEQRKGHSGALSYGLFAAMLSDASIRDLAKRQLREHIVAIKKDGIPFEIAAIATLAAEGLWTMELMKLEPFTGEDRARVFLALRELIDGAS